MSTLDVIQAMITPGILVSSCGLLLLGTNNKYSLIIGRVRSLNEELRKPEISVERRESLKKQLPQLAHRMRFVRNAVFSYSVAVLFLVVVMMLIGASSYTSNGIFQTLISIVFFMSVLSMLAGIIYACLEVWMGYRVMKLELEQE